MKGIKVPLASTYMCTFLIRHLLDTLQLPSSPPCPSRPLKHQIQYIMFSIGPIEFPSPLLNELVLREPAGNESRAVAGLHFRWFAIHFPPFSCTFIGELHFPECITLWPHSVLLPWITAICCDNKGATVFTCQDLTTPQLLHIKPRGGLEQGPHTFPFHFPWASQW